MHNSLNPTPYKSLEFTSDHDVNVVQTDFTAAILVAREATGAGSSRHPDVNVISYREPVYKHEVA